MDCVSQKSKMCTDIGNEIWKGMCSNCADLVSKSVRKSNSLTGNDYREGLSEVTDRANQIIYGSKGKVLLNEDGSNEEDIMEEN